MRAEVTGETQTGASASGMGWKVRSEDGSLLRSLGPGVETLTWHAQWGWVSSREIDARVRRRARAGLRIQPQAHQILSFDQGGPSVSAVPSAKDSGVTLLQVESDRWEVLVGAKKFLLSRENGTLALPWYLEGGIGAKSTGGVLATNWAKRASLVALLALAIVLGRWLSSIEVTAPVPEAPVVTTVVIKAPEKAPPMKILPTAAVEKDASPNQNPNAKTAKRAVAQDLGFLGLIGKKDLKNAMGGMPTVLTPASAGAGQGGMEGSGGELLVGVGKGVQKTTVGNSGMAGLGGVGTKGAGGGAGGYGNTMIGSGEGMGSGSGTRAREIILDGGLDKAVIQATIAKYLSQVRSCYEEGMRRKPGIQGRVGVQFEIGGDGSVRFARVQQSSLGEPAAEKCITERMMDWQFPKPVGGINVKVNYPFVLKPNGTS